MFSNGYDWSPASSWQFSEVSHGRSLRPTSKDTPLHYGIKEPIHQAFYARLDPGGFVIPHIDAGPWFDRWHVPVEPAGGFWQSGEYLRPTEVFQVKHWLPHAVFNDSDRPRVHLIVDRDAPPPFVLPEDRGLVLTDMIPEVQALIDRLGDQ